MAKHGLEGAELALCEALGAVERNVLPGLPNVVEEKSL